MKRLNPTVVILAAGDFPKAAAPLRALHEADLRICCDSAAESLVAYGLEPDRIVGDMDSLSPKLQACYADIITHVAEQDDNDLTKAFHLALTLNPARITLVGATGRREDHTLGNISLLAYYAMEYPEVGFEMVGDYGVFLPFSGVRRFETHQGQQVSLFSLTPDEPVSVSGLRYPIEGRCLRWWWEGTLNEALGDSFEVRGGKGVVYLLTGKK